MQTNAKVNVEAKNHLARLLATENIWIQHRKVPTASFDLVSRILTFPIWKEMSSDLYTMLAGHEVGHALYSEKASVQTIGARIDPKNPALAGAYWNVVEDARVERLIKGTYPGLIRTFVTAYKDLFDRNFFGTEGRDLQSSPFIDRINLYFKIGHLIDIEFSDDEKLLVEKVRTAATQNDVVEVTKEIYLFAKHEHTPPPEMPPELKELLKKLRQNKCNNPSPGDEDEEDDMFGQSSAIPIYQEGEEGEGSDEDGEGSSDSEDDNESSESGDGEDSDGDESEDEKMNGKGKDQKSGDSDEGDEGDPSSGKEKSAKGKKADKGDAEGSESDGDADSEGDGESKKGSSSKAKPGEEKKGQSKQGKQAATGKDSAEHVDPGPPPDPYTQRVFDQKIQEYNDKNALPVEYVTLPKPNLEKIIVPHTEVHTAIRNFNFTKREWWGMTAADRKRSNAQWWAEAEASFLQFRKANVPKVNYIFQQFMMKKQADRYKRTRQHKTGSLDPLRLHAYKIDEDLFKTIAIVSDDKNHGLIFVVDWSGSMQSSMAGTLEQLMMLCMFCRKAGIPFEVYSLTTGGNGAFSKEPGNLVYADNFRMRCYLTSQMSARQFYDACVNLFVLMPNGVFRGGPAEDNLIGCTPLDESIITTIDLMEKFRRKTKAQIVNAIFMTDGDANTVNGYYTHKGYNTTLDYRTRYLIDDRKTHKVYDFTRGDMTPTMLTILRDRQDINVVGFYIGGHWRGFFGDLDDAEEKKLTQQFAQDGYVIATDWGYSELYITREGDQWRVKDLELTPDGVELGTEEYDKKLGENFTAKRKSAMKQRVMLDRFIKMIA